MVTSPMHECYIIVFCYFVLKSISKMEKVTLSNKHLTQLVKNFSSDKYTLKLIMQNIHLYTLIKLRT